MIVPSNIEVEVTLLVPTVNDENTDGSKSAGRIEPFNILDEFTESFDKSIKATVPSNILLLVTASVANFGFVTLPSAKSAPVIVPSNIEVEVTLLVPTVNDENTDGSKSAGRIEPFNILDEFTESFASFAFVTLPSARAEASTELAGKVPKSSKRANVPFAEGKFKLTAAVPFKTTSLTPERVKNLPALEELSNFLTAVEEFGLRTKYLRTPLEVK